MMNMSICRLIFVLKLRGTEFPLHKDLPNISPRLQSINFNQLVLKIEDLKKKKKILALYSRDIKTKTINRQSPAKFKSENKSWKSFIYM